VANFTTLANRHFYDGTTFHRVIPKFMIQGGDPNSKTDPNNDGRGGPGYFIEPEFSDSPHLPGTLSMARQSEPATAGSQFFIMTTGSESWRPQLDHQYTVFGHVLSGQEIVDRISAVPRDRRDRPLENVTVDSITVENPHRDLRALSRFSSHCQQPNREFAVIPSDDGKPDPTGGDSTGLDGQQSPPADSTRSDRARTRERRTRAGDPTGAGNRRLCPSASCPHESRSHAASGSATASPPFSSSPPAA
jgi:peptidyl-prolyl cis-trans isomerase B (cyclophilin B)